MEILEVVANLMVGIAGGITGETKKSDKRTNILGWSLVIVLVIALFLFTLIMSQ